MTKIPALGGMPEMPPQGERERESQKGGLPLATSDDVSPEKFAGGALPFS